MSGNVPGAVLMPVNLWGAVPKPGIHHVPTQTDLLRLLSYAGGPQKDAKIEEITIKRTVNGQDKVIPVDLQRLLSKPGQINLALEPNDIVMVPQKDEGMSPGTLRLVTFASLIFSTVLTGFLISDHINNKVPTAP